MNPLDILDFNLITAAQAPELLKELQQDTDAQTADYLEGRYLGPKGSEEKLVYWTGPILPTAHVEYVPMRDALMRAIAADNLLQDTQERLLEAVEGIEDWQLTPRGATEDRKEGDPGPAEETSLMEWGEKRKLASLFYQAGLTLCAHGRTVGRPLIAPAARNEAGSLIRAKDDATALSNIHWQAPGWPKQLQMISLANAGIWTHPDTLQQVSVVTYTKDSRPCVELSWVLPNGLTRLKIIEDTREASIDLDLQGRLMLVEATLPRAMVTRSMLGAFSSYIVASTMLNRNTHYAGFVEKWAIGVVPPGNWKKNPDGTLMLGEDGQPIWEPEAVTNGPNSFNFYQPESFTEIATEPSGTQSRTERPAAAQMGRWEPVDPKAISAALNHWREAIYREARQTFMLMADDANASGIARQTAAGDYLRAAEKVRSALAYFVTELLELTLSLAALQRDGKTLTQFRVGVNSRVQAFAPSPEQRNQNREDYKEGLLDWETAILGTGAVNDADLIMPKIEAERAQRQAEALQQAQAVAALTPAQPPVNPNG